MRKHFSALAFGATTLSAGLATAQDMPRSLAIMLGAQGRPRYGMGAGLAQLFTEQGVRTSPEVGSGISNVAMVATGRAPMGFLMTIVPRMARLCMAPFDQAYENVCVIAQPAPSVIHIVVSVDSGVETVAGLAGKPFATQPFGNLTTKAFKAVLFAKGLSKDDLELTRGNQGFGASEMKDRRIVGYTATTSYPSPSVADVSQSLDVKFLPISDEAFAALREENPAFSREVIPAGTFNGQDEDIYSVTSESFVDIV